MLSMGFIEQLEMIIQELPKDRVTLLFSATLPKDVERLCHRYMNDPVDIEIKGEGSTKAEIEHSLFIVRDNRKLQLLQDVTVMENPDSCIIFCRTQVNVDEVHHELTQLGYPIGKIHGGMEQDDRNRVMGEFRNSEFRYLVATDVAARGIDIDRISHVINYDFPMEKESYVHRAGRTGRAGNKGKAISFVTPNEDSFLANVEAYIGFKIRQADWPPEDVVDSRRESFELKLKASPELKQDKKSQLSADILKLHFNGGKKNKLRAVDFVGTIAKIEGMTAVDIGIITIEDNKTYVEILNGKGQLVLQAMKNTTVKGKLLKVQPARKL